MMIFSWLQNLFPQVVGSRQATRRHRLQRPCCDTERLEVRTLLTPFYDLSVVASTADGFVGFGDLASINNMGTIAFVGYRNDYDSEGNQTADDLRESGLWIRNASGGLINVNPDFSDTNGRDFGRAVALNDEGILTARDRNDGNFFLREWDSSGANDFTTILSTAPGLITFGKYSGFQTFTDINNRGDVAFVGQSPDGQFRTLELQLYNQPDGTTVKLDTFPSGAAGGPTPRPQLTNDGRVLARLSNGNIVLFNPDGTLKNFVAASDGFSETGAAPGITADGRVVVFTGNRGRGAGVFAAYYSDGVRHIVRIAGEGLDGWTEFDLNSAVRVSGSIANDSDRGLTVAFEGTNSSLGHGIYTARVSFFGTAGSQYHSESIDSVRVSGAAPVALMGDSVTPGGPAITDIEPYGMNDQGRGELAFWVKTGSQEAIVRALPQQLVYVDMNPGLYPLPGYTPANLGLLAEVGLQNGWEGNFADAMQSLGYTGNTAALTVSIRQKVQEIFDATGARITVVSTPPDTVPRTATDEAGNVQLVNGVPVRNGAFQTVQVGMNSATSGKLGLAAPVYNRAGELDFFNQVVDDLSVVFADKIFQSSGISKPFSQLTDAERAQAVAYIIAHEAAHNFGLAHIRGDYVDDIMHGATQSGEFEEHQEFNDEPTELSGSLGIPGAAENPTARLLYATGGTYARRGDAPLPALLQKYGQFSVYERYKLDGTLTSNNSTVARIIVGTVSEFGDDFLPEFQDMGSGTLSSLFGGANFMMPKGGQIIVIGSTDGVRADIIGIPTSAAGIQNSLSLSALGIAADSRLQGQAGDTFNLYRLPVSGPAELIGTFSAEGEPAASIRVGSAEIDSGSTLGLGETVPNGGVLTKTLTIVNSGAAPLVLGTVAVTGPGYSVTQPSQTTLAPGEQTTIVVTLSDATAGNGITGTLTIPSNAAAGAFQLTLRGTVDSRPRVTGITRIDNGTGSIRVQIDFSGLLQTTPAGNPDYYTISSVNGQVLPVTTAVYTQIGGVSRVVLTTSVNASSLPSGTYDVRVDGSQVRAANGAPLATSGYNVLAAQAWNAIAEGATDNNETWFFPTIIVVGANGSGQAGVLSGPKSTGVAPPEIINLVDLNGDGLPDYVATSRFTGQLVFHWGQADGGYETEVFDLDRPLPNLIANPTSLATADWNQDGYTDLVVFDSANDYYLGVHYRILIYLNDGQGNFTAAPDAPIPVAEDVYGPILGVGDFTGDGLLDVAVAGPEVDDGGSVAIYGKDPFLGYGQTAVYPTEHTEWFPESAVMADLNGDGRQDLVVSNTGFYVYEPRPVVYLSTPSGLVLAEDLEYDGEAGRVGVGDVSGDGQPDIVIVNDYYSNSSGVRDGGVISVLRGSGSGQFTALPNIVLNRRGTSLASIGDVNGDGKVDLVLQADPYQQAGFDTTAELSLWSILGDGTGGFDISSPLVPFAPTNNVTPGNYVLRDMTGDGAPDLTFGNSGSGQIGVFVNNGAGQFAANSNGVLTATVTAWNTQFRDEQGVFIGDLNRDGFPDQLRIVGGAAIFQTSVIDVLWGNADGEFHIVSSITISPHIDRSPQGLSIGSIGFMRVGDVNNDGWLDILVGDDNGTGSPLAMYLGVDGLHFEKAPQYMQDGGAGVKTYMGELVDINSDSNLDYVAVVLVNGSFGYGVFFGDGTGKLTYNANAFMAVPGLEITSPNLADFNGDGKLDLAVGIDGSLDSSAVNKVLIYNGLGNGKFTLGQTINRRDEDRGYRLFTNDINGDGKLDIITAGKDDGTLNVFLGSGTGQFTAAPDLMIPVGYQVGRLVTGDFTGDGVADLAVTRSTVWIYDFLTTIAIYPGQGGGVFVAPQLIETGGVRAQSLALIPTAGTINAGSFAISQPVLSVPTGIGNLSLTTLFEAAVAVNPRPLIDPYTSDPYVIAVDTDPMHGTVTVQNSGTPDDLTDDSFLYTPANGYSGGDSFTYSVADGRGGSATRTVTITVTPKNLNPVITLSPGTALMSSLLDYQAIDPNATVSDSDSTNFRNGKLTVEVTGNPTENDRLAFNSTSPGPGELVEEFDSTLYYNGALIGKVTGGYGDPLVVMFTTDAATPAAVSAVLARVAFYDSEYNPAGSQRTISITISDGDGGSATATKVLDLRFKSDGVTPTLTLSSSATSYSPGGSPVKIDSTTTVTDSDSTHFAGGYLIVEFGFGTYTGDTLSILSVGNGAGQINLAGDKLRYGTQIFGELNDSIVDKLIVNFNSNATPAIVQALIRQFAFSNSTSNPNTADRAIYFLLSDGAGYEEAEGSKLITFGTQSQNQDPEVDLSGGATAYSAGQTAVVIDAGATASDADATDFEDGVLTVSLQSGGAVDDRLAIKVQGTGTGQINLAGDVIRYGANAIGSYSGGFTDNSDLVISLFSNATPTSVTALLRSVTFSNADPSTSTATRTIRFVLEDGQGGSSDLADKSVTVSVSPGNPAPTLQLPSSNPTYSKGAQAVAVDVGATVLNPTTGSGSLAAGALTVSINDVNTGRNKLDIFSLSSLNGIGVSRGTQLVNGRLVTIYDLNSNVTAQTVQNAIRGITFKTSGKGLKFTTRSVKIQLEDSEGDKSAEVTKTINVSKKKVKVPRPPRGRSVVETAD